MADAVPNGWIGILVLLGAVAICVVVVLCCCMYRCAKWCSGRIATSMAGRPQRVDAANHVTTSPPANRRPYTVVSDDKIRQTTVEMFVREIANQQPIQFTAEQLERFTDNYSAQLGAGGFGTVYKGDLPCGLSVAVKLLHGALDRKTSAEQFMAEMRTIGRTHHVNLVRLSGFCFEGRPATHALVYEFMPHGSLDAYLSSRGAAGVSMDRVVAIATGVAKGLRYLHEECRPKILHLDIKPANVLLDGSLTPKVADFGLARLLNLADTHISVSSPRGTPGYTAPEMFLEGRVTHKCDVYSFGMLLLYIIHRVTNLDTQEWFARVVWIRYEAGQQMELLVPLPTHGGADRQELVEKICRVAFWCVQREPRERPSMSDVVKMLEGEKKIDAPPYPFKYLDARTPAANLWEAMQTGATGRT